MTQSSEMRNKLQAAIRLGQQAQQAKAKHDLRASKTITSQAPTIKLKTDFSNFT